MLVWQNIVTIEMLFANKRYILEGFLVLPIA